MSQKITRNETLSETQERLFAMWREHPYATHGELARAAGVSRETVNRLMNEEQFLARLDELHEGILSDAVDIARLASRGHASELAKLLGAADARDRMRAAEMILERAAEAAERQRKRVPVRTIADAKATLQAGEVGRFLDNWPGRKGIPVEEPRGRQLTTTESRILEYKMKHPHATQETIGKAIGLSREHVNRTLRDETVQETLRAITAEAFGDADKMMNVLTRAAVEELDWIARDDKARPSARLRAMKILRRFAERMEALPEKPKKLATFGSLRSEALAKYWSTMRALGDEVFAAVSQLMGPASESEVSIDYAAAVEQLPAAMCDALRQAFRTQPKQLRVVIPEHVMEIIEPFLAPRA